MNRLARHALFAVVLALAAFAATAASGEPALEGMYEAHGLNPDGSEYRGLVQITRHGESFIVSWIFPEITREVVILKPTSIGIGIASTGVLAVSYYGARDAGLVIYRIEEDGKRLEGRWTLVGEDGAVHTETLTLLPGTGEPAEASPPQAQPPRRRPPVRMGRTLSL